MVAITAKEFLQRFMFGAYLSVSEGDLSNPDNWKFYTKDAIPDSDYFSGKENVFFGVANRSSKGNEKSDIAGSVAAWVEIDDERLPYIAITPSAIVKSGHGYHVYWFLDLPPNEGLTNIRVLEAINKLLSRALPGADKGSWNANRFLRVPFTINKKEGKEPVKVELLEFNEGLVYTISDLEVLGVIDQATAKKIVTGNTTGYKSRSELIMAVLVRLIGLGLYDDIIIKIFETNKIGERLEEKSYEHLLAEIEKARNYVEENQDESKQDKGAVNAATGATLQKLDDGYYIVGPKSAWRLSTFILEPKILLDGSLEKRFDAIVCDVKAGGNTWENVTFSKKDFDSKAAFQRVLTNAEWSWLGKDEHVNMLFPMLIDELREQGRERVLATPVQGLHEVNDVYYYVGNAQTLSSSTLYNGANGPISWLPTETEHPKLNLNPQLEKEDLELVKRCLPKINEEGVIWPMIGWYAASLVKAWIEKQGFRFPMLHLTGTKGSGKTSTQRDILLKLFGHVKPNLYDASTTNFVLMSLLGSNNGTVVAFDEYRADKAMKFRDFMLMAYDTGQNARGTQQQKTITYPLIAPFSVGGEDIIADAAVQERIIVVRFHPYTVEERTDAWYAFKELKDGLNDFLRSEQGKEPINFGGWFIQKVLEMMMDGSLKKLLKKSQNEFYGGFEGKMNDRIRNNHMLGWFGIRLFCTITSITPPQMQDAFTKPLKTIVNLETGRGVTTGDEFVRDIANSVRSDGTHKDFKSGYSKDDKILWFQLSSAMEWWIQNRRRQGRAVIEQEGIKHMLYEAEYIVKPRQQKTSGIMMYGIDLEKAADYGLDVPRRLVSLVSVENLLDDEEE